jgi:uncharacterized membrane protein
VLLVAVGWIYVVLMMAVAEATSPQGTLLGALITFLLYGVLPLGIVLYLMGAPLRARARQTAESAPGPDPDDSGHATGDTVAPERKEP